MEKKLLKIWEELDTKLLFFISRRIKNKEDAEDILQEVYIKLHENISLLKDDQKIVSWIYQITRNTINECYRKCYRLKKVEFEEYHIEMDQEEKDNLNDEVLKNMKQFIEILPEDSKKLIKLYEFEGMSHKEISKKLDIKENTSKSKLKRAKEKLKKQLDECCIFQIDKFGNVLDYAKK